MSLPRFATVAVTPWEPHFTLIDRHHSRLFRRCLLKNSIDYASGNVEIPTNDTLVCMHKATKPIPQRALTDELWEIEHLACFLRVRVSAANAYAKHPDFPVAIGGNRRCRRWYSDEVHAFFRSSRGNPVHTPRVLIQRSNPEIHSPQRKA